MDSVQSRQKLTDSERVEITRRGESGAFEQITERYLGVMFAVGLAHLREPDGDRRPGAGGTAARHDQIRRKQRSSGLVRGGLSLRPESRPVGTE